MGTLVEVKGIPDLDYVEIIKVFKNSKTTILYDGKIYYKCMSKQTIVGTVKGSSVDVSVYATILPHDEYIFFSNNKYYEFDTPNYNELVRTVTIKIDREALVMDTPMYVTAYDVTNQTHVNIYNVAIISKQSTILNKEQTKSFECVDNVLVNYNNGSLDNLHRLYLSGNMLMLGEIVCKLSHNSEYSVLQTIDIDNIDMLIDIIKEYSCE